jgi:hypothetical protein
MDFCKMILEGIEVVIQLTGDYASSINGKAEAPHKTVKQTSHAMLTGARMSDDY